MENIKIGNIEFRTIRGLYEIVKWYPNAYYGKESEYTLLESGNYTVKGKNAEHVYIDKAVFKNPESCYTLAFLKKDDRNDDIRVELCWGRIFDLEDTDYADYNAVVRQAYKELFKELVTDDDDYAIEGSDELKYE
jgi:hypothetical protein